MDRMAGAPKEVKEELAVTADKPSRGWIFRNRWYLLSAAVLLVLALGLGLLIAGRNEQPVDNVKKDASVSDSANRLDGTEQNGSSGESTITANPQDNPNRESASTAPTQTGPTANVNCVNDPPAGFGFAPPDVPDALTIKAGFAYGPSYLETSDGSGVIWTSTNSPDGSVKINPVVDNSQHEPGSRVSYGIFVDANAKAGNYEVSWHIEDGTRNICQTKKFTVTVVEP